MIANTLHYLKQHTIRNYSYDLSLNDRDPPTAPICIKESIYITCESSDQTTTYRYKVSAHNRFDYTKVGESNVIEVEYGVIKSFTYWFDDDMERTTVYDVVSGRVSFPIDIPEPPSATLNIFASDFSGNSSPVARMNFPHLFTSDYGREKVFRRIFVVHGMMDFFFLHMSSISYNI